MTMSNKPEGWYPDPVDSAMERHWNGSAWTQQTRLNMALLPPPGATPLRVEAHTDSAPAAGSNPLTSASGIRRRWVITALVAILSVAAVFLIPQWTKSPSQKYLEMMQAQFPRTSSYSDSQLLDLGYGICRGVREQGSQEVYGAMRDQQFSLPDASILVFGSIDYLCPELKGR